MESIKKETNGYQYDHEEFMKRFCNRISSEDELDCFIRFSKDVLIEEIYKGCDSQRNNIILILMYMGFHSVNYNKQCSCSLHELLTHALNLKPYTANYNALINTLTIMQEHNFIEYDEEELISKKRDESDAPKQNNKYIDNVNFIINPMIFNPANNFIIVNLDAYNIINSVNPKALIVYLDIMKTMNNSKEGITANMSYPYISTIAYNSGYSPKTVEKMIKQLEGNDIITKLLMVTHLEATFGQEGIKPIHRNIYQQYNRRMGNYENIKIKAMPKELIDLLFKDKDVFTVRDLDTNTILWHKEDVNYSPTSKSVLKSVNRTDSISTSVSDSPPKVSPIIRDIVTVPDVIHKQVDGNWIPDPDFQSVV